MKNNEMIRKEWKKEKIEMMVIGLFILWKIGIEMIEYIIWGKKNRRVKERSEREERLDVRINE